MKLMARWALLKEETNGAFMCNGNYDKYQKQTWKIHMNTPSCVIFHWATRRIF